MTEQEVFNKVWDHIITQGKPSLGLRGMCLYRGPNGLKCAAGIFLTDKQAEELDHIGGPWVKAVDIFPELERLPRRLISSLQDCHDGASIWDDDDSEFLRAFKDNARAIAKEFNLTVPEGV